MVTQFNPIPKLGINLGIVNIDQLQICDRFELFNKIFTMIFPVRVSSSWITRTVVYYLVVFHSQKISDQ